MSFLSRIFGERRRVSGRPPSGNGASSFHLWWEVPPSAPLVEVSAVLEVVEPPTVDRLYFWAMQMTFTRPEGGGAHIGLQHHPKFPGSVAANWGGYAPGGGLLAGSPSPLPSTPNDPNTRDFPWEPGRRYRLRVVRGESADDGSTAWRGVIEDESSGDSVTIRDLYSPGTRIRNPAVWTEAFALCEEPPAAVRWSDLGGVDEEGRVIAAGAGHINYQSFAAGGCSNTSTTVDDRGWTQRTGTPRPNRTGDRLVLPT